MMIKKETEMTEFEKNCYGMTQEDIREQYMESITAKLSGLEMVVMGMLSDSQEMLNTDYFSKEDIRKQLNKAKFILSEIMEAKRV
jgi:chromosome condensin MukBEF ATPase and DNA-binding subunit MukB